MTDKCSILKNVEQDYPDYLRDESRKIGRADSISFPVTEEDVKDCLATIRGLGVPVTIQGARTGITGGAVPAGGHIINLSRMNKIGPVRHEQGRDFALITVQPGALLQEINKHIADETADGRKYFFPPDPTETSASIGGMISCNASGAKSFFYGATRLYVDRLRLVLADSSVIQIKRGEYKANGRRFSVKTESGRVIEGALPAYKMPDVKNAAGYFIRDDMDLIDLFVGFDGTLGIITEADLRLLPEPAVKWGVMIFFPSEEDVVGFVKDIRIAGKDGEQCKLVAIEFFDSRSLDLLRTQKNSNPAFKDIPHLPAEWRAAIYIEYHGDDKDAIETAVMGASEIMTAHNAHDDATWLASEQKEMERLKGFRHAVPEAVNLLIDERRKKHPSLTKLGTDLAVPDDRLDEVMKLYHDGLAVENLEYVIFGHIGDNHVHVNILPNDMAEYERGGRLYQDWAKAVVGMGGTVSGEHGIGNLKKHMLKAMYGEEGIRQMQKLKALFDPEGILNRDNLF